MTPKYKYNIFSSIKNEEQTVLKELINSVDFSNCVRIVLFASLKDNKDYKSTFEVFEKLLKEKCSSILPAYSLVAQAPFDATFAIEVCTLEDEQFTIESRDYGVIVKGKNYKEIIAGGINSDYINLSIEQQSKNVFTKIDTILKDENCAIERIVRQWNYIEYITHEENGMQNYQIFNDARSLFYSKAKWSEYGYPAATGIGASSGGIMVDFNAIVEGNIQIKAIDNPLQIAAHEYSKNVLLGEKSQLSTPKFERAKGICSNDNLLIYVSGTAAIRGENSLRSIATEQTITTIENINYLISKENQVNFSINHPKEVRCEALRVYVKNSIDYNDIKCELEKLMPITPKVYLLADVCRDELLVEIETIAQ